LRCERAAGRPIDKGKPRIVFTGAAVDDLRRIGPSAVPPVLKKLLVLETDSEAGFPLGDELTGFRKLVVGRNSWRTIYRITGPWEREVTVRYMPKLPRE
jgi:mRNA interferase RelE/StbE